MKDKGKREALKAFFKGNTKPVKRVAKQERGFEILLVSKQENGLYRVISGEKYKDQDFTQQQIENLGADRVIWIVPASEKQPYTDEKQIIDKYDLRE